MFTGSCVRIDSGGVFEIGEGVVIRNSNVYVDKNSSLTLGNNTRLENVNVTITNNGCISIGELSYIEKPDVNNQAVYLINGGTLTVANNSHLQCDRVWIRFGGRVNVGEYTTINYGSEIRSDESVSVGSYVMCSYNTRIWDTNTHTIYPPEQRLAIIKQCYPNMGTEVEKPKTAPVCIGDFCWIGERSAILKGSTLGRNVKVGYNTTISAQHIEDNKTAISQIELKII
ncbi:MAG: acyltransferase [Rikenellaceae bacterium]